MAYTCWPIAERRQIVQHNVQDYSEDPDAVELTHRFFSVGSVQAFFRCSTLSNGLRRIVIEMMSYVLFAAVREMPTSSASGAPRPQ